MDTMFDVDVDPTTTMRRCGSCHEMRPLTMFYIEAEQRSAAQKSRNGCPRKVNCRVCQRERNAAGTSVKRAVCDRIKGESGCADCGLMLPDHPEVFDFDHLPGVDKVRTISKCVTSGTMDDLLAEIAKCEVVCSNCHRIRTRIRGDNGFGQTRGPYRTGSAA